MRIVFSAIDALQDDASPIAGDQKTRAMWFTGIGTGGPAITAGVMLLLNKIAIALFTGLGPIFILCLLFDQTKQLFGRWLFYGIGTMFSLAVLSVMVALSLDVVKAVSIAFWVNTFLGGSNEGVNSMALQQGGLGLVLTMLIISAPPMAAAFFQGTLGNFMPFSQFGGSAGSQSGARGPGSPPVYHPPSNHTAGNQRVEETTRPASSYDSSLGPRASPSGQLDSIKTVSSAFKAVNIPETPTRPPSS